MLVFYYCTKETGNTSIGPFFFKGRRPQFSSSQSEDDLNIHLFQMETPCSPFLSSTLAYSFAMDEIYIFIILVLRSGHFIQFVNSFREIVV